MPIIPKERDEIMRLALDWEHESVALGGYSDRALEAFERFADRLDSLTSPEATMFTPDDQCCHAARDGDCIWPDCPQLRDDEPRKSGRSCPLKWFDYDVDDGGDDDR